MSGPNRAFGMQYGQRKLQRSVTEMRTSRSERPRRSGPRCHRRRAETAVIAANRLDDRARRDDLGGRRKNQQAVGARERVEHR